MAGIKAFGAKLSYTDGGKKYVAHLTSLGAISMGNEELDVTDHDSPNKTKEFIAGDRTFENLSFEGNVADQDDTFKRVWALGQSRVSKEFVAEYADGSKMTFTGYIAKIGMGEMATDGLMTFSGEVKISGDVVFTPAG